MTRALFVLLFCAACGSSAAPVEEGLLDRKHFIGILVEAQVIESRVNHELMVEHVTQVPVDRYYDELFRENGITREQFERTFDHYAGRPEELRRIYEEVIAELARRKDTPPR